MQVKQITKPISDIYNLDSQLKALYKRIEKELPAKTVELIRKYDREMINSSLAKVTRLKHLQILSILSKQLNKEWEEVTKEDIEILVSKIMEQFAEDNGQESNYSYDNKKVLKIFFRWLKLGSREFKEVGDPEETRKIRVNRPRDKIVREDLVTEEDKKKLLDGCAGNLRDRALIDVQSEAGTRAGEILTLKIKDVKFDEYGAVIHVYGKTGGRTVR